MAGHWCNFPLFKTQVGSPQYKLFQLLPAQLITATAKGFMVQAEGNAQINFIQSVKTFFFSFLNFVDKDQTNQVHWHQLCVHRETFYGRNLFCVAISQSVFHWQSLLLYQSYIGIQDWEPTFRLQRIFSQHFIFFVTYEWDQQAIVLLYTRMKRKNTPAYLVQR